MHFRKRAFITGITGQDGTLLAELLLEKNYDVHGLRLYSATDDTQRIEHLLSNPNFTVHYGDLTDGGNVAGLLSGILPSEIYNLGAQSHVKVSFDVPEATANINGIGTLRLLEAMRTLGLEKKTRFYQASSSEMFGTSKPPQNEETPFHPCSPYGTAKLYAYWIVRNYRDSYGMHASNGILFNHESPIRGEEFVTRKITRAVAAIEAGVQDKLMIGNLDARRDWGHAKDYVEGMWRMLQQDMPDDFVLATGRSCSVRDFINVAFSLVGIDIEWQGEGLGERGVDVGNGRVLVEIDQQFFRPNEVHCLIGDASKAKDQLGWEAKTSFEQLVQEMLDIDMREYKDGVVYDRNLYAAE